MRSLLLVATALTLGAGCRSSTNPHVPDPVVTPPGGGGPTPVTSSLKVVANDSANFTKPVPKVFMIQDLQFLVARLETTATVPQPAWGTLKLTSPFGTLHENQHVPFTTDPKVKQVPSSDPGQPAVDTVRIKYLPVGQAFDFAIPVAGTEIGLRPQPGLWKVVAAIDDVADAKAELTIELGGPQ
jgi:hypothetical protein